MTDDTRAAPTPEASAPEPADWQSRADRLVGGDLRRLLPGEIVAAYERCREYIVMPRQGTEYGLFSAKADLWRVVTYAATVAVASLRSANQQQEPPLKGEGHDHPRNV